MAAKIPKVWSLTERATLAVWIKDPQKGQQLVDIQLDSDQWFQWLELPDSTSFKFEPADQRISSFTAYKEAETTGDCWYAYKKIDNKLHKCYIGVSKDLTLARLRELGLQMLKLGSNNNVSSQQSYTKEADLVPNVQLRSKLMPDKMDKNLITPAFSQLLIKTIKQAEGNFDELQELAQSFTDARLMCLNRMREINDLHPNQEATPSEEECEKCPNRWSIDYNCPKCGKLLC